ncbi:MAG TPA: VOC family protein [Chloroflexota bacterium]|nr:VOC family protein [Chloroflexota bacterium]
MAKIKHIAIMARDQEKTAEFYKKTFDMFEVWRHDSVERSGSYAVYLSDGYINLAILPARAGVQEGINHFGFEIDDIDATAKVADEAGATQMPEATPKDGRFAEAFIKDPAGTRVDLSVAGWLTEPAVNPEYAGPAR